MRKEGTIIILLLCLSFLADARVFSPRSVPGLSKRSARASEAEPAPEAAQSPASDEEKVMPHFQSLTGSDFTRLEKYQVRKRLLLLGVFEVANPDSAMFALLMTFKNGGILRHADDRRGELERGYFIRLDDLELRYTGAKEEQIGRKLADEPYKGKDGYYEVLFVSKDNLLTAYRIELWGAMRDEDLLGSRAGEYMETLSLKIEFIY